MDFLLALFFVSIWVLAVRTLAREGARMRGRLDQLDRERRSTTYRWRLWK